MKTVKFITLGCKVNQYDTQEIRERFLNAGMQEVDLKADVYVINSCTVTHKADSESLAAIRRSLRENPKAKIIVTGCFAELDRKKITALKGVRWIVKNKDKKKIPFGLPGWPENDSITFLHEGITFFKSHARAFLKIQDGCNNACSYCKVPLVRGRSISKPLAAIVQEAEQLAGNSYKEIVLTGVCLGSYGKDLKPHVTLVSVIDALEKIPGILRIRLSSIEAKDVTDELLQKMAQSQKLCRHLHLPLQSGDNHILKLMNRRYSREDYLRIIEKSKKIVPGVSITTDILVGFPGEEEQHFSNTLDLVKKIKPLRVHTFPYSKREGTRCALRGDVPIDPIEVRERMHTLVALAEHCSDEFCKEFVGMVCAVLIEGESKKRPGFWEGYTDNYILVFFPKKGNRDFSNILAPLRLSTLKNSFVISELA